MMQADEIKALIQDSSTSKEALASYFLKAFKDLKSKYEEKLVELDARATAPKTNYKDFDLSRISNTITKLEILLFIIKTPTGDECKYCRGLVNGEDEARSIDFLRGGILKELNIDRDIYHFEMVPCDWDFRVSTPEDHPDYSKPITEEGLNWFWLRSMEVEGFPSLRITIENAKGIQAQEFVDGLGVYDQETKKFVFGVREIVFSFLSRSSSRMSTVENLSHRNQNDGSSKYSSPQRKNIAPPFR